MGVKQEETAVQATRGDTKGGLRMEHWEMDCTRPSGRNRPIESMKALGVE